MWYDPETGQLIVNGQAGWGRLLATYRRHAGKLNLLSVAGPGLKHDIQRTFHVRNLHSKPRSPRNRPTTSTIAGPTSPSRACATWTSRVSTR